MSLEPSEILIRASMFWYEDISKMFFAIRFNESDVKERVIRVVRTARVTPLSIILDGAKPAKGLKKYFGVSQENP